MTTLVNMWLLQFCCSSCLSYTCTIVDHYREERIVHVNLSWVTLTGHIAVECEGRVLSSLFHDSTEEKSSILYSELVEKCSKKNANKVIYGDESSKDYSAYSTDSESSEDTQLVGMLRTANIVLNPPPRASTASGGGFQSNPWGTSSTHTKQKMSLLVTPAAIKSKHMAFLFCKTVFKKNDNNEKGDMHESSSPRKRSKSMKPQGTTTGYSPFGCSSSSQDKSESDFLSNSSFDSSSHSSYAPGTYASTDDTARKRLLRCSTMPTHQPRTHSSTEHGMHRIPPSDHFPPHLDLITSKAVAPISDTKITQDSNLMNNVES